MTDDEILHRWAIDREIAGGGSALAHAFERRLKKLEEELSLTKEGLESASECLLPWKELAKFWRALAEDLIKAAALRDRRGKCGMKNHHSECDCDAEGVGAA